MNRTWLRTRMTVAAAVVVASAAAACSGAHAPTASPASHPLAHARTIGSGRPGLSAIGDTLYVGWSSAGGTGAGGQLNLGRTTDGGKTISMLAVHESTAAGQGPALDSDGRGLFVAWPDNAHTLNLAYYDGRTLACRTRLVGVTSLYSPALAHDGSGVRYLAWADQAGRLNFARVESAACGSTGAMTLADRNTALDTTVAGPALAFDVTSAGLGLVVLWAGGDSANGIYVASYVGATVLVHRVRLTGVGVASSTSAPGLAASSADLYLRFRGTDGKLYTAYSEGCNPSCFSPRTDGTLVGSGVGMTGGEHVWVAYFDDSGSLIINGF